MLYGCTAITLRRTVLGVNDEAVLVPVVSRESESEVGLGQAWARCGTPLSGFPTHAIPSLHK